MIEEEQTEWQYAESYVILHWATVNVLHHVLNVFIYFRVFNVLSPTFFTSMV